MLGSNRIGMHETEVTRFLDDRGVAYTIKEHEKPALTCNDAAIQRACRLAQIVKCMVGSDDNAAVYIMLLPGDRTLKIRKVRKQVGGKRVTLIPPEDLVRDFDLTVGAISPIQLVGKGRFLVDPSVLEEEFVDISAGDPTIGIELASRDLLRITGAEIVDIVSVKRS